MGRIMTFLLGRYTSCWCKAIMSLFLQSGSVIIMRRRRGAVRNVGIAVLAISKACGKSGTASSFHAFHQVVISTAGAGAVFGL